MDRKHIKIVGMPVKHSYLSTNRPTDTVEAHTNIIRIFYIVHVGWAENIYQYILCTKMGIEQAALNMHGNR